MNKSDNYLFKILVVGCCAAGKTCSIRKIVYNQFTTEYKTTIGVDFSAHTIKMKYKGREVSVCLQFWDIAGQEYYSQLSRAYYKGAYGCFLVCDLTSETLQQDVKTWKDEVSSKVYIPGSQNEIVPTILLCNKIDLPQAKDIWETETVQNDLEQFNFDKIFTTSAVTGEGLDDALQSMAQLIFQKTEKFVAKQEQMQNIVLPVEEEKKQQQPLSKGGCC